jgi:hypothetical protein
MVAEKHGGYDQEVNFLVKYTRFSFTVPIVFLFIKISGGYFPFNR